MCRSIHVWTLTRPPRTGPNITVTLKMTARIQQVANAVIESATATKAVTEIHKKKAAISTEEATTPATISPMIRHSRTTDVVRETTIVTGRAPVVKERTLNLWIETKIGTVIKMIGPSGQALWVAAAAVIIPDGAVTETRTVIQSRTSRHGLTRGEERNLRPRIKNCWLRVWIRYWVAYWVGVNGRSDSGINSTLDEHGSTI